MVPGRPVLRVFIDTSAFYALISPQDARHQEAVASYGRMRSAAAQLVTTSYVLVECVSLIQRRIGGAESVRAGDLIRQSCSLIWVDDALHRQGWFTFGAQDRRLLSLVDCVSFAAMKQAGIRRAFAFDQHFSEAGFELE